jgi:catechol 2,3-dioxygenase-like lactoylglutathione lyase family enzyme
MALQLNHVHLKTSDPDTTAQFYVETLGATIVGKAGAHGYRLDLHGLALGCRKF